MRDAIDKRNELKMKSIRLRNLKFIKNVDYDKSKELDKMQDEIYKRYLFFDNMLKAKDKVVMK